MHSDSKFTSVLAALCDKLKLSRVTKELLLDSPEHAQFSVEVLGEELMQRDVKTVNRLLKKAKFPYPASFDGYLFDDIEMPKGMPIKYFIDGQFVSAKQNLFLYGPPGTGKTHMAVAIGFNVCNRMKRVFFWRASELIALLAAKKECGELKRFYRSLCKSELLIVDEFGFMPSDGQALLLYFDFQYNVCSKVSTIYTSNLTFEEWFSRISPDEKYMPEGDAALDRMVENTYLVRFKNTSHRQREFKRMNGIM